jgi:O-methyltransferase
VPYRLQFLVRSILDLPDVRSALRFLLDSSLPVSFVTRLRYVRSIYRTSYRVDCAHTQSEILECVTALLSFRGSTRRGLRRSGLLQGRERAKFSAAARLVGRDFVAFDSFEGLPANDERHGVTILGDRPRFDAGRYRGALEEVEANIRKYGSIESVPARQRLVRPDDAAFSRPIAVAYLDVDLVSSTRTCLQHLYPLLEPGRQHLFAGRAPAIDHRPAEERWILAGGGRLRNPCDRGAGLTQASAHHEAA